MGFLSSGDSDLLGNYGLWDQILCLQWIKNYIAAFGGNPTSITIFGQSAGGISVSLLALMPVNSGLFQRAIMQSGTALMKLIDAESESLSHFGKAFNCINESIPLVTSDIVDCLRSIPAVDLMQESMRFANNGTLILQVGPVIDGVLLTDHPKNLLTDPKSPSYNFFRSLDIIIGTTNGEGSLLTLPLYQDMFKINMTNGITSSFLCNDFSPTLTRTFYNEISTVAQAICNEYKVSNGDTTMIEEQGKKVVDLYRDAFFISPAVDLLDIHSYNNTETGTYQYSFEEDSFRFFPVPKWFKEAQHGADLPYLFGLVWLSSIGQSVSPTSENEKLLERVLTYWTNFAKTGAPNVISNTSSLPVWPAYATVNRTCLHLTFNITTSSNIFFKYINFWRDTVPKILNPIVQTNSGPVKGVTEQHPLGTVIQYRGIPFARPPVGKLRFEKPQRISNWKDIFDATKYPPSCMQPKPSESVKKILPNKHMTEDCLYLNIYVPGAISASNRTAVMIWIHGGGFYSGQASIYDGSFLANKGDIIYVATNYRVGLFGFLSSGDSVIKGNYGLWDQRLAIEWVKNNIEAFGGDPSSITIFGQSAGGFSVGLQSLCTLNRDLFQRSIAMSGTSVSPIAYSKSPSNTTTMVANMLNCTNTSSLTIFECLKNKSTDELMSAADKVQEMLESIADPGTIVIPFLPTVDQEMIQDVPEKLLQNTSSDSFKFFKSLDLIVGTNDCEGITALPQMYELQKQYDFNITRGIMPCLFCDVIAPLAAEGFGAVNLSEVSQEICANYKVKGVGPSTFGEQGRQTLQMYGDEYFVSGALETLNSHSKNNDQGNSYHYLFARDLKLAGVPPWFKGSSHGGELPYMFDALKKFYEEAYHVSFGQEDIELKMKKADYWINFAKTGNPNSASLPVWPKFSYAEKNYLEFGADTTITDKRMLWPKRMELWSHLRGKGHRKDTSSVRTPPGYQSHGISSGSGLQPVVRTFLLIMFLVLV